MSNPTATAPTVFSGGVTVVDDDRSRRRNPRTHRSMWGANEDEYVDEYESKGKTVTKVWRNPRGALVGTFNGDLTINGAVSATSGLGGGGVATLYQSADTGTPAATAWSQVSSSATFAMNTTDTASVGTTVVTVPTANNAVWGTSTAAAHLVGVVATVQITIAANATYAGEHLNFGVSLMEPTRTVARHTVSLDLHASDQVQIRFVLTGVGLASSTSNLGIQGPIVDTEPTAWTATAVVLNWAAYDYGEA